VSEAMPDPVEVCKVLELVRREMGHESGAWVARAMTKTELGGEILNRVDKWLQVAWNVDRDMNDIALLVSLGAEVLNQCVKYMDANPVD
jgi:hypothetical protein